MTGLKQAAPILLFKRLKYSFKNMGHSVKLSDVVAAVEFWVPWPNGP